MDEIKLSVPAAPEHVRLVRLIAAGLATRLEFTLDDIDDLKIGVDELCAYLTGLHGRSGSIEIRFLIDDDRIEVHGVGHFGPGDKVRTDLTELSRQILQTVADTATLEERDGIPQFALTKQRRSSETAVGH